MPDTEQQPAEPPKPASWLARLLHRLSGANRDVIAAQVTDASHVAVGKNIIQIGQLLIPLWAVIVICVSLLGLLATTAYYLLAPAFLPVRMPDGSFNIAVAPFSVLEGQETSASATEATELSNGIAKYIDEQSESLKQILPGRTIEVWGPADRISPVTSKNVAQIAKTLNADIIIYGTLSQVSTDNLALHPEFYLSERAVQQASELMGQHALGRTIDFYDDTLGRGEATDVLRSRLEALIQMLAALIYQSRGTVEGFHKSLNILRKAENSSVWLTANDHTGQEIFYLFLGIAHLHYATTLEDQSSNERTEALIQSREAFSRALELNPQYARVQNGLGFALTQLAYFDRAEGCGWDWAMVKEAEKWFLAAMQLPPETKPVSGQADFRATFGLGQLDLYRGYCFDADRPILWQKARENYLSVTQQYRQMEDPASAVTDMAALTYIGLGIMDLFDIESLQIQTSSTKLSASIASFESALSLISASQTDVAKKHQLESMPYYLTALCANHEQQKAQQVLDDYLATQSAPDKTRSAIQAFLDSSQQEGCLDENT
jgi:hypothetical protein